MPENEPTSGAAALQIVSDQAVPPGKPKKYCASCTPDTELPDGFAKAVMELERLLNTEIWLLVQNQSPGHAASEELASLADEIIDLVCHADHCPKGDRKVCLLLDSPGGYAKSAYRLARTLQVKYKAFSVLIPRRAKSAATLLALGAERILLSEHGELGPLDVQIFEADREDYISALDEVQALERLSAFSLEVVDRTMMLLVGRTGKKIETLLPFILQHAAELTRPLIEKIDTVHYTQMSRSLKVAEEYAIRLLKGNYEDDEAKKVARHLVNNYPDHSFAIDALDAKSFGLRIETLPPEQESHLEAIRPHLNGMIAVGRLREVKQ